MLIELRVKDFAVIQDVRVEFGPGLIVLTGETGAGKSILVDALSLLLGERASSDVVRTGADRARVEAVFDVSARPDLGALFEDAGVEPEDGVVILRREVAVQGRNRAWINGSPTTVRTVGLLGRALADLHGQHEHQTLLRKPEQRDILDAFANASGLAATVRELFGRLQGVRARIAELATRRRDLESRADFLRFQLTEIDDAQIVDGEEDALRSQAGRLAHAEELSTATQRLCDTLYEGPEASADLVAAARDELRRLATMDPTLAPQAQALDDAYHRLVETARELEAYASGVEHDPDALALANQRLDVLQRLKRKYGGSVTAVLETAATLRSELSQLDSVTTDADRLEHERTALEQQLEAGCAELTRARTRAARTLSKEVQKILPALGLEGAVFQIRLDRLDVPGAGGREEVEFRASLNPGFDPKPLARIASGGELSRVMLALKSILADVDRVPTLVFDEVDAGVGGAVAVAVAEKLARVADRHQVFVVTHLAQVASRADRHLTVSKDLSSAIATTDVELLDGEERVREIARMLGGDPESSRSREHARELLSVA